MNFESLDRALSRIPPPLEAVLDLACPRCPQRWWFPWGKRREMCRVDYEVHWLYAHA